MEAVDTIKRMEVYRLNGLIMNLCKNVVFVKMYICPITMEIQIGGKER